MPTSMECHNSSTNPNITIFKDGKLSQADISVIPGVNITEQVAENESFIQIE